mmetsp:Transcript_114218/g.329958  ORF Transcript_114218/g.329958 Transcript_114218/m.329958 type:complete len:280 (+) Transcript_114218:1016-1855(+)
MLLTIITLLATSDRPVLSTAISVMPTTSSTMSIMFTTFFSTGCAFSPSISIFSDLAISMMFVTRSSNRTAQPLIMFNWRFCKGFVAASNMDPLRPMMPCKGLLNSCPRTAVICAFRSFIAFIVATSVRSWPIAVIVRCGPPPSCTMRVSNICTERPSPSASRKVISTAPELSPLPQASMAVRKPGREASATRSKMLVPTAVCTWMPETLARCSFHATTTPSALIAKIGALARRKRRLMSFFPISTLCSNAPRHSTRSCQFRTTTSADAWRTFSNTSPMV